MSRLGVAALGCIVSGCMVVGPDHFAPEMALPETFVAERDRGLVEGDPALRDWWTTLDDPVLTDLVERSVGANLDLRAALERIREARAFRAIADTGLRPTIDAVGSYDRIVNTQENALGAFTPRAFDAFRAGLDVRWELDVFGQVTRRIEAADAELDASVEDVRDVLVAVVAEVALAYVELRTVQERQRIARANIDLQGRTLGLTEDLFDANLVGQLDVAQARALLESTRSTLPPLETAERAAKNRLAVLLGVVPGALEVELADARPIPVAPAEVAVGIPAEVIRRRPDVRRAERLLAAQTARVGVSEAALYPTFAIGGTIGVESEEFPDMFRSSAASAAFGPSVSWNLFDRERLRDAIRVEEARQEQALLAYERTVLLAFEEIENAMTGFVRDQLSRDALVTGVGEARRAVELSRDQYRQGLVSFQSVLDPQQTLFSLEDQLAVRSAAITTNLITLYKALGGGWDGYTVTLVDASATDTEEPSR